MNARIRSAAAVPRPCRDRLFVQVILCASRPELVGRTWSCRVVTTEPHALEFLCERPLPPGALVDLWVDLSERPGKYFLSGFVHGSAHTDDGRHRIRVLLEDGAATDIDDWVTQQT